jgi:dTDP-4-amino-4,6-dideoxyglucose formyltransferase
MINVLVVSDNVRLVKYFKNEVDVQKIMEIATFKFCYSAINKKPSNLIEIGMELIDLKDFDTCNRVKRGYDLVLSLHSKQIFPKDIVSNIKCINFHPGLNPHNRGWFPQVFSIINKKPIGATIHLMDELVDHGKIIDQEQIEVLPSDTSFSLYNRVVALEEKLISKNLKPILLNQYKTHEPEIEGNYNSIKDFKQLCELDLNHSGTLKEHIELLRALTHGDFQNAYYYDKGEKVYISVNLLSHSISD